MKKVFAGKISWLIISIFYVSFLHAQTASTPQSIIDRYKKLYKEDKISGEAYMTMLLMSTTLSVADQEEKLKQSSASPLIINDQEISKAFNTFFSNENPSMEQVRVATQDILISTGLDKKLIQSIGTDLQRFEVSGKEFTDLFSTAGYLSDQLSYLSLKSSDMSSKDILYYLTSSVNLNSITGNVLFSPEMADMAATNILQEIEQSSKAKAINQAKRNFFLANTLKLTDYSDQRNKQVYPDFELNASNWKQYFKSFHAVRSEGNFGNKAARYSSDTCKEGIIIRREVVEVTKKELNRLKEQSYEEMFLYFPVFTSNLKFDYSKDFEFRMKISSPTNNTNLTLRMNVADCYSFNCTAFLGNEVGSSLVTLKTGYNPKNNKIESFQNVNNYMFKKTGEIEKELVIKKKGNTLIAFWANEAEKIMEISMTDFYNKNGLKFNLNITKIANKWSQGDVFIIKNISLKYL